MLLAIILAKRPMIVRIIAMVNKGDCRSSGRSNSIIMVLDIRDFIVTILTIILVSELLFLSFPHQSHLTVYLWFCYTFLPLFLLSLALVLYSLDIIIVITSM